MTIASRRLARRCRERLASDTVPLPTSAEPSTAAPPTTIQEMDEAAAPLENVDATT
jgi:hypothetical protein